MALIAVWCPYCKTLAFKKKKDTYYIHTHDKVVYARMYLNPIDVIQLVKGMYKL